MSRLDDCPFDSAASGVAQGGKSGLLGQGWLLTATRGNSKESGTENTRPN